MSFAQELHRRLRERLPAAMWRPEFSENLVATFPAACPEVGDLQIYDDGDEATIYITNITHSHFNPYDAATTNDERVRWIVDTVIEFLEELLADRVLLWSVDGGRRMGGWRMGYTGDIPKNVPGHADVFLWSRRLR